MSLWRCPDCGRVFSNSLGEYTCPVDGMRLEYCVVTGTPSSARPPAPYHGKDRRKPRPASWLEVLKFTLALFGLATLVVGHLQAGIADLSGRELLSVAGGIFSIVFALLTDSRIFSQLRALQRVLDPEDDSQETV